MDKLEEIFDGVLATDQIRKEEGGEANPMGLPFPLAVSFHIAVIISEEFEEPRCFHQTFLKQKNPDDGAADAQDNINQIVMCRIDCREPYSPEDDGEKQNQSPMAFPLDGVPKRYHHISRMERREGGEDVGIAAVNRAENRYSYRLVEANQAGCVARRVQDRLEPVIHHIPRRSSGMNVITDKANQVYQKEHHGKAQVQIPLLLQIKPYAESHRDRHPAKVEDAGEDVGHFPIMEMEIFVGRKDLPTIRNAKQVLLGFVQALHVDRIHLVVRENTHPIVGNGKNGKG